jgi:hypothetical protein
MPEEYRKILDELSDVQETLQRIKIDKHLDRFEIKGIVTNYKYPESF